jgi:putative endonuclease
MGAASFPVSPARSTSSSSQVSAVRKNGSFASRAPLTNDLVRRVNEHKQGLVAGFTSRYRITRPVYFEVLMDMRDAIAREKEIKGWARARKVRLIDSSNPAWEDLAGRVL